MQREKAVLRRFRHSSRPCQDHRTDVEVRDIDKVLKNGEIEEFLEAEKEL
jgi:protein subunit release factor A